MRYVMLQLAHVLASPNRRPIFEAPFSTFIVLSPHTSTHRHTHSARAPPPPPVLWLCPSHQWEPPSGKPGGQWEPLPTLLLPCCCPHPLSTAAGSDPSPPAHRLRPPPPRPPPHHHPAQCPSSSAYTRASQSSPAAPHSTHVGSHHSRVRPPPVSPHPLAPTTAAGGGAAPCGPGRDAQ